MSDLPAPPFKNFMELRLHSEKDREFRGWVQLRLSDMGVSPLSYVRYAGIMDDRIYVEYDDGTAYDSVQELDFAWDELMDASNDMYRKAQEERVRKEQERRDAAEVRSRVDAVKNLERALEDARQKLEEAL
jgi:hypothetical protein